MPSETACSRSGGMGRRHTVGCIYCVAGSMVPPNPMRVDGSVDVGQIWANELGDVRRNTLGVA